MTCEQVRELLPEHLLGSLDETTDARVRLHLRGCTECRAERVRLEDGVAALSYATHEAAPPDDLRDRVLGVLDQEWSEPLDPPAAPRPRSGRTPAWRWVSAVAAALLVVSLGWSAVEMRRADRASADASSYQALLATLGGREFRLGELHPMGSVGITGTVLLYDGSADGTRGASSSLDPRPISPTLGCSWSARTAALVSCRRSASPAGRLPPGW
ncbi:MAG: anti-sigma factor [Actinomycetota bacterium]|nr:anti-sigma factor [Actinomycetota bacterium]